MKRVPIPVIVVALLLIASGAAGLVYHLPDLTVQPSRYDVVGIALLRLAAIVAGVYLLRGSNWARWLALAWIAFHVLISFFNSWAQVAIHVLVFAAFAYLLFRPRTTRYFEARGP